MSNTDFSVDFIGAGMPKSGTTWIYKCLEEHPEVCIAKPKELHFFHVNDPKGKDSWKYDKGISFYREHFQHCTNERIRGEFGPKYFFDPEAPRLIAKHFPNTKIIITLRHPVDRTISRFQQQLSDKKPLYETLEAAIADARWLNEKINYRDPLERFYYHFPSEQILLLFYEDLKHDPASFIQRVFRFLEIDDAFTPETVKIRHNASHARHSKSNRVIKKHMFKIYRTLLGVPGLGTAAKRAKQKQWNVTALRTIDKLTLRENDQAKNTIAPQTKQRLASIVQPEIERLEEFLGYTISQWR